MRRHVAWVGPPRDANMICAVDHGGAPSGIEGNAHMFWIYWDTAWSIILGGVMFTTILAHPDAEFIEVTQQREGYLRRTRDL
jgi:hypothetical protein